MQRSGQQRDRFDSILKHGLQARRDSSGSQCPDEATVAAYCDGSLTASENTSLEEHFANCARCQPTLAAIARAGTAQAPEAARPMRTRWELYAALAAAVAGISIVFGLMRTGKNQIALYSSKPSALPAQIANAPLPREPEPGPQIALNQARVEPRASVPSAANTAQSFAAPRMLARRPIRESAQPEARHVKEKTGFPALAMSDLARKTAPGRLGGVVGTAPAGAPPAPVEAPQELAQRPEFEAVPGAPATSPGGVESESAAAPMAGGGFAPPAIAVRSPDGVERWRLGANGAIEHRNPDGSWQAQHSGVAAALTAGAAPSPAICWIVGTGGTILRTTDGEHWQIINSPTSADLIAVSAANASDATVTASDGKHFHTSDGGSTWHLM